MAESPGASLFSGDHFPVLVPAFSQECSSHSSTFQGEQFPSFSFPSSPSRITYSLGSQLINNSISWGWREWIEFPCIFFFFFCLQPAPGSVPSPEQQQVLCSQLEKIHTLFRRQLGIPLLGKGIRILLPLPHQVQLQLLGSPGWGTDPSGSGMLWFGGTWVSWLRIWGCFKCKM